MKSETSQQGTTLLELLIALALMSIVTTGLISVYWAGNSAFERQYSISEAQYCARTAMQWIVKDINSSFKQESNTDLNSETLSLYIFVKENETPQAVSYFLDGTNLRRNNLALMENINYIYFMREADSELITIIVEAEVNSETYRLTNAAVPRISLLAEGEN